MNDIYNCDMYLMFFFQFLGNYYQLIPLLQIDVCVCTIRQVLRCGSVLWWKLSASVIDFSGRGRGFCLYSCVIEICDYTLQYILPTRLSFVPLIVKWLVNIWDPTVCTSTEYTINWTDEGWISRNMLPDI